MCGGTSRNDDERGGGICRLSATRRGQFGPQQPRREDDVGSPRLRFTSPVVARGAQNRGDHKGRAYGRAGFDLRLRSVP